MKKAFLLVCVLFVAFAVSAQQDITTFLGIPIDGTKKEMIAKLKEKGFEYNQEYDYLTGQFNGRDVNIFVVTNNNKVYRICVIDAISVSETDVRIRFNNLCSQFLNNKKYVCYDEDACFIPESENFSDKISYQMTVNKKRYQASFYQFPYDKNQYFIDYFTKNFDNYTQKQLDAMTEEERTKLAAPYVMKAYNEAMNRSVWFMISEDEHGYDKYKILMFYDNKLNESNGEDL